MSNTGGSLGFKRDQDQATKEKTQIDRLNHLINSLIERLPHNTKP